MQFCLLSKPTWPQPSWSPFPPRWAVPAALVAPPPTPVKQRGRDGSKGRFGQDNTRNTMHFKHKHPRYPSEKNRLEMKICTCCNFHQVNCLDTVKHQSRQHGKPKGPRSLCSSSAGVIKVKCFSPNPTFQHVSQWCWKENGCSNQLTRHPLNLWHFISQPKKTFQLTSSKFSVRHPSTSSSPFSLPPQKKCWAAHLKAQNSGAILHT